IRVCQELSRRLDLHLFNRPTIGKSVIRLKFTGAQFNSSHVRNPQDDQALHASAGSIQVYQLQGNLFFATTEPSVRDVLDNLEGIDYLIFDLRRVLSLNESAGHLLHSIVKKLAALDKTVVFTHHSHLPLLRRMMKSKLGASFEGEFHSFTDNDLAL